MPSSLALVPFKGFRPSASKKHQGDDGAAIPAAIPLTKKTRTVSFDRATMERLKKDQLDVDPTPATKKAPMEDADAATAPTIQGLPGAASLAKILCRIVDSDSYTIDRSARTLQQLTQWLQSKAAKEQFFIDLSHLGCTRKVLLFLEEHFNSKAEMVYTSLALQTLAALTEVKQQDDAAVAESKCHMARMLVQQDASTVLLRLLDTYVLEEANKVGSASDQAWTVWTALTSQLPTCNPAILTEAITSCNPQDSMNSPASTNTECELLTLQILAHLAPFTSTTEQRVVVVGKLCLVLERHNKDGHMEALVACLQCLEAMVAPCQGKSAVVQGDTNKDSITTSTTTTTSILRKKSNISAKTTAKRVTQVTVAALQKHDSNAPINQLGVRILQSNNVFLTRAERKKLGVVAVLGGILANDTLPEAVKSAADALLEENVASGGVGDSGL